MDARVGGETLAENMMGITLSDGLVAAGGDFSAMTTNARDCGRAREMVGRDE